MSSIPYRPDVDGLRAIAVLSVVFYHAEFSVAGNELFEGGFIGVDIFFVISGYLITKILLADFNRSGTLQLREFYDKRGRRILPALFVVMLASFFVAPAFLFSRDLIEFYRSILAALFYVSNFFFYAVTTSYGAESSLLKPMLHTWSLGVEEQFYIIFPLLLLLLLTMLRRGRWVAISIFLLLSLSGAEYLVRVNPELGFFITTSRLWELLAGSLVALALARGDWCLRGRLTALSNSAALVALAWSVMCFGDLEGHPGFVTLIPVLATAVLLMDVECAGRIKQVLSSRPALFFGKLSYSLYLWHFPVFAFARTKNFDPDNWDRLLWILLSLILAYGSYRLIETPFRNRELLKGRLVWPVLIAAFLALSALSIAGLGREQRIIDAESRAEQVEIQELEKQRRDKSVNSKAARLAVLAGENLDEVPYMRLRKDGKVCYENFHCEFPDGDDSALRVVFLGDSHLGSVALQLNEKLPDSNKLFLVSGACPFALGVTRSWGDYCTEDVQRRRLARIESFKPDVVVLMANYMLLNGKERMFRMLDSEGRPDAQGGVRRGIERLLERGYRILQVYPYPHAPWNIPKRIVAESPVDPEGQQTYLAANPMYGSYSQYRSDAKVVFDLFDSIASDKFYRVYPHQLFCREDGSDVCLTHDTRHVFYWDDDHPSRKGAEMISGMIVEKLAEISAQISRKP